MTRRANVVRIASDVCVAVAAITVAVLAVVYLPELNKPAIPEAAIGFSRAEFITIILSAVTVVLTALTLVLAVAGAIGYVTIRDAARDRAGEVAGGVAARVATEIATGIAARTAETMANQVAGRDEEAGDDIAKAAGEDDGNTH